MSPGRPTQWDIHDPNYVTDVSSDPRVDPLYQFPKFTTDKYEEHGEHNPDRYGGFQPNQRFQIKSRQQGGRVFYVEPMPFDGINSFQRQVHLRAPEGTPEEFWIWNEKTHTIRSATNPNMVLSFYRNNYIEPGDQAVIKPFEDDMQAAFYDKRTDAVHAGPELNYCFDVAPRNGNNKDDYGLPIVAGVCDGNPGQQWFPWYSFQSPFSGTPHWDTLENVGYWN